MNQLKTRIIVSVFLSDEMPPLAKMANVSRLVDDFIIQFSSVFLSERVQEKLVRTNHEIHVSTFTQAATN